LLDLRKLQVHFQDYLLEKKSSIKQEIVNTENVSVEDRLSIYHEGYFLRLQEALQADYKIFYALLGADEFNQLTRRFILSYPSSFRSIRWYGKRLASFMQEMDEYLSQPYLLEMVQFEWLLTESFDALDCVVITIDEMASIPFEKWSELQFIFHPSLRKMTSHWNIIPLWNACNDENVLVTPQKNTSSVSCMIWRSQQEIQFCTLSNDESCMIEMMQEGKNFGEMCVALCEWIKEEKVAMHAALLLKRYITSDLIIDVS